MKLLFAGNKERGLSCLISLREKHDVVGVIGHKQTSKTNYFVDEVKKMGCKLFQPSNINDKSFIKQRVQRQKILKKYTPKITSYSDNFYVYKKIEGKIFSKVASISKFDDLLIYLKNYRIII